MITEVVDIATRDIPEVAIADAIPPVANMTDDVSSIGSGGSDAVLQTAPEKAATPYTTMIFSSSAAQEITK